MAKYSEIGTKKNMFHVQHLIFELPRKVEIISMPIIVMILELPALVEKLNSVFEIIKN